MIFLLILAVTPVDVAQANACAPLNLVTQPNSPFNQVPVTDQDGVGLCYAYAGAQLMNYQLVRQGREPSVHQLYLGIEFTRYTRGNIEYGNTAQAISHLQSSRNCPASRVREALASLVQKATSREEDVYGFIIKVSERLVELQRQKTQAAGAWRPVPLSEAEVTSVLAKTNTEFASNCHPGTRLEQIFPEIRAFAIMTPENVLNGILSPFCQQRERLPLPAPRVRRFRSTEDSTAAISETITGGQTPVAVSYCARVLYDPNHVGVRRANTSLASDCSLHESLGVGQRPAGASCEFLLRNSWGTSFGRHTQNAKCLCRHRRTGAFVNDCTNATHNNGNYTVEACWINSGALSANAVEMTWL
jgi:hypothetical protein